MKAVVQRVVNSKLEIEGKVYSSIDFGLLVLLGVTHKDTKKDLNLLCMQILITAIDQVL